MFFCPLSTAHKIVQLNNLLIVLDVLCRQNMFSYDADVHHVIHTVNMIPLAACRDESHRQQLLLDSTQFM